MNKAQKQGYATDRFKAACTWALVDNLDSAFDCLERIVKKRVFANYDSIAKESNFTSLHSDKRWQKLLDALKLYNEYLVPPGWFIAEL